MGIEILFVDDDKSLLQGIGRVIKMERKDIKFSLCSSAGEAMELLKGKAFDAVVADYRMPVTDGIDFLKFVRENYSSIKRVLLTGQSETEVYERAAEVAHKYISKPCGTIEIINTVEKLIKASK